MSLKMYLGETDAQTKSMNAFCIQAIQGMEEAIDSIDNFTGAVSLQGETYRTAKGFMSLTFRPLAQGIIYLCEELIRQNDKYPSDFRSQVATTDVVEQEIIDQIIEIDRLNARLDELNKITPLIELNITINRNIKQQLEIKLNRLHDYNASSSSNYATALQLASSVAKGLAQVQGGTGFNSKTGTFSTEGMDLSWIATVDDIQYTRKAKDQYGDYLKQYPENLDKVIAIIKYEETNPEYVDQTNEFLSPLEDRDVVEIKYLIYTAEEPYRSLAMKYLDRFEIAEINAEPGGEDDGVFRHTEDAIFLNMDGTRTDPRGNYYTFFHEIAHAFDYYYGQDNRLEDDEFFTDSFEVDGKTLNDHMYIDAEKSIRSELANQLKSSEYDNLSLEQKAKMINNITENVMNQDRNHSKLLTNEQDLQAELEDAYESDILEGPDHNTASDVFSGVTNHVIRGSYKHKEFYWVNEEGDRIRKPNREGFAEYFGRIMVPKGDSRDAGLDSIEEFLPDSKEHMDKIFGLMNGE